MGLLRLLLALSVVVTHSSPIFGLHLIPGDNAVQIFFVISGFYMALILSGKYTRLTTFYLNRFLRLYPVYFLVAVATWGWFGFTWIYLGRMPTNNWVTAYGTMSDWQIWCLAFANWTLIGLDVPSLFHYSASQGFMLFHYTLASTARDGAIWAGDFRTIGQAWSIGVEIWFYLLAPFLIRIRSWQILLLASLSLALDIFMAKRGITPYFFFPAQAWFFLMGILLYRLYRTSLGRRTIVLPGFVRYPVVAAVVAVFAGGGVLTEFELSNVAFVVLIPAIPLLFSITRESAWDLWFGNLSYPIYILHMLVVEVMANSLHSRSGILIGGLSVAGAIGLLALVDTPINRVRQVLAAREVVSARNTSIPIAA